MHILPETKPCECGMKMILRSEGPTILTMPPKSPQEWYCGGCGRVKAGPTLRHSAESPDMSAWRQVNGLDPQTTTDFGIPG